MEFDLADLDVYVKEFIEDAGVIVRDGISIEYSTTYWRCGCSRRFGS